MYEEDAISLGDDEPITHEPFTDDGPQPLQHDVDGNGCGGQSFQASTFCTRAD